MTQFFDITFCAILGLLYIHNTDAKCPLGWKEYATRCYRFHFDCGKSRGEAQEDCRREKANLVSINSRPEERFILSEIDQILRDKSWNFEIQWWTGGKKSGTRWYWADERSSTVINDVHSCWYKGSRAPPLTGKQTIFLCKNTENLCISTACDYKKECASCDYDYDDSSPFTYTNWLVGEPNNSQGRESHTSLKKQKGSLWGWNDEADANTFPYICEASFKSGKSATPKCKVNVCKNGGTCYVLNGRSEGPGNEGDTGGGSNTKRSYFCLCPAEFSGTSCERDNTAGWYKLKGSFYKFHTSCGQTRADAFKTCAAYGGHLVSIESSQENNFLKKKLDSLLKNTVKSSQNVKVWTSGRRNKYQKTKWYWEEKPGSGKPITFTDWHRGEPNNANNNEPYLVMWNTRGKWGWNDINGNHISRFICEIQTGNENGYKKYTSCKLTRLGTEYLGTLSTTIGGKTCQRWDKQYPHKHAQIDKMRFPERSLSAAQNYCRNPNGGPEGPWCYTTDRKTRWQYCNVPYCGKTKTNVLSDLSPPRPGTKVACVQCRCSHRD